MRMPTKQLAANCECKGTGVFPQEFSNGSTEVECPAHHPAYQEVYSVDELLHHLNPAFKFNK